MTRGPVSAIAEAIVRGGREAPEELAFAFGGRRLHRGELLRDAARLAAGLRARGVGRGERVALILPAGLDFVRGVAGAMLAGCVPFSVPPQLPPGIAVRRAARGRPALAIAPGAELDALAAGGATEVPFTALEALSTSAADGVPLPRVDPESPLFLQPTSGSTGEPRLAAISHRALAAWRRQAEGELAPRAGEVLVGWAPPWHVMGLVRFVLLPILVGAECHLVPPTLRALPEWLETAASARATLTAAPDSALRAAVRLVGARLDLGALRQLVVGGEPVRASTIRDFEARFGLAGIVRPAYGLAEATLTATAVRAGEAVRVDAAGNVSCGRPLPGVELRVVGARGEEPPGGAAGEIQLRSAALFSGYFGEPTGGAVDAEGWLATGDWGRLGGDGELYVVGRRRNLLKHGGATHAPRELEEAAERVDGVLAAAAVALARGDAAGAVPVVVVEAEAAERSQAAAIAEQVAVAVRRDAGLLPAEVLVVEPGTLPRTEGGKLRHAALRAALASGELARGRLLFGRGGGWSEEEHPE